MEPLKILDLFAGVCGLSSGFEMVRDKSGNRVFELYRAVEINKYACETLRKRYGEEKVVEGDLTKEEIRDRVIRECKGKVKIVAGGIPCQSFSLIGPRSGFGKKMEEFKEDKRDHLYKVFRMVVREINPWIIVIENVKGILSKKDKNGNRIIDKLIADFERLGYNFKNRKTGEKYMILNAADYGVPQKRERVILIGINRKWKKADVPFPKPSHYDSKSKDEGKLSERGMLPYVTLYEAIGDLPTVEPKITRTGLSDDKFEKIKKKNMKIYSGEEKIEINKQKFLEHLSSLSASGKNYFSYIRPNGYEYIHGHIARMQQLSDIELFAGMKEGWTAKTVMKSGDNNLMMKIKYNMDTFKDKYRKQRWDEPCTTVFAHLAKDGNRFIHPEQARTITPREAARIQSFPDNLEFQGPMTQKFKQIGNAVPPLMAKAIAEKITEMFE